jgi:hypothetical protein
MEKILLEFADTMLPQSTWYILREDGSMPENQSKLACLGWHDAEKMALTAYASDATHVVYLGYEDRGFLGEGNIFSQCLKVISCRVDRVSFPTIETYSAWCTEHGIPVAETAEKTVTLYLGYAQLRSSKISAQVVPRKRDILGNV